MEITKSIFREYDIRGEYPNQINEEVVRKIGNAIAGKCINSVSYTHLTLPTIDPV